MRFSCIACLIVVALPRAYGQVFEVAGGSSSLYEAQGGTLSARGLSYDASIGAGVIAGRFVGGANITKMIGRSTYILGDDYIRFLLPTDIFDTSHYLIAQGVGIKTTLHKTAVFGFAGALSNEFDSPLFEGARAQSGAGILFLTRPLTPTLTFASKMVFSGQTTAIESLDWLAADKFHLAVSGGVGANQPYAAASLDMEKPRIDVKTAYIEAGSRFHRVAVDTPLLSEPDRENIVVTLRPVHSLSFTAARQNYLTPIASTETNARSSVDQVSGNLQLFGTSLNASLYHSSYLGESNTAAAFTADREFFSRVQATANYLISKPEQGIESRSLVANFTEMLTPRWNATEVVNRSQGQNSISFGGSFLSNLASISAEYQTYYVPERSTQPFEQALILDVQLNLLPGLSLHGATFVAPGGALSYTAEARDEFTRQSIFHPEDSGDVARGSIGTMMLRGQVLDVEGHPIAGAALMIDQLVVYTNDDGLFYIREHKTHSHQLRVLVNQFLGGGVYRVVSAPPTTRSSYEGNAPETVVVVQRISASTKRKEP